MIGTWQPIETAPRDGTRIIVSIFGGYVTVARYFERQNQWWEINNDPSDSWGAELLPSYWMPLPDAPANTDSANVRKSTEVNR